MKRKKQNVNEWPDPRKPLNEQQQKRFVELMVDDRLFTGEHYSRPLLTDIHRASDEGVQ